MVKHVDDARAFFGPFWADVDDFQELNRDAQVGKAVNRWPLIKAMPIGQRELPRAFALRQERAWIEQPERFGDVAAHGADPVSGQRSDMDRAKDRNGIANRDSLSDVFDRLERSRRSLFRRLLRRSESSAR